MQKLTLISLQTFLLLILLCHVNSQLYDQEHEVLLKLKQYWQNPPSIDHWTLSSSSSHCTWREINCTDNSITTLSIIDKNINGTIPPFICDLKNLRVIDLQYNYIPGTFPRVLYNCSKLEHLDLSQNYLVGPIPNDIDSLSRLQYLNLGANNFSGDIPAAIGRLQELRNLQLYQNQFNGTFPPEIGNLSKLEVLKMFNNRNFLPSKLPSDFTRLKKLKILQMLDSKLIGELPEMLGDMAALEVLDLSRNDLTGKIPSGLFTLKNLSLLYLYKNRLSGEIPQVIGALNLTELDLSENNLTGKIPDDIGKLEKLSVLLLFSNQLSGEVPETVGRIRTLTDFRLFSNNLSGVLPSDFGRYSMLEGFEVSSNSFTGRLPEHICYGGKLLGVVAFDNNLSGELPESLGDCGSLVIVNIHNNSFTGKIPVGLWTSLNLSILIISDNLFTGELPDKLSGNLSRLEINSNRFFGEIPAGVNTGRNLVVLIASNNLFNGTIPTELTTLPSLTILLLDRNQLTGFLPSDIIAWKTLTNLNLSRNQISGQIPEEIGLLPVLNELDLSENRFSGQIPPQIGFLKPTSLNLSSNHLTGKIPIEFENAAYSTSFLNNPGLCAISTGLNLTVCNSSPQKSNRNSLRLLPFIFIVIVVFVLALSLLFFAIKVYRKKDRRLNSKWELTSFQRLNFTETNILSGLKENNMIGSGGSGKVYRVSVTRSGYVAVKKIWNNRNLDQKLEKEFLAEVQILSTIRHLNIVKLMCCISSENSKLLVYEYLENRCLDQWLHKKNRPTTLSSSVVLNWPKRLHIAVGAARGLCYMHHDCSPSIVHRDVKSSNILLDSEFNAKIADFGLAKMLITPGEAATMSAVAGSFGYLAPEYAHTRRVNEKIDVYSFGVILLELTTGREAHHGDEHTCLAEWAWHHIQENKPIVDALDEDIKETHYLNEMSNMFKLGIICTSSLPSARPCMKEVVELLLRIRNTPLIYKEKNDGTEYDAAPLLKNSRHEQLLENSDAAVTSEV